MNLECKIQTEDQEDMDMEDVSSIFKIEDVDVGLSVDDELNDWITLASVLIILAGLVVSTCWTIKENLKVYYRPREQRRHRSDVEQPMAAPLPIQRRQLPTAPVAPPRTTRQFPNQRYYPALDPAEY